MNRKELPSILTAIVEGLLDILIKPIEPDWKRVVFPLHHCRLRFAALFFCTSRVDNQCTSRLSVYYPKGDARCQEIRTGRDNAVRGNERYRPDRYLARSTLYRRSADRS